ncbi:Adenosine deaminase [compost metagenome]
MIYIALLNKISIEEALHWLISEISSASAQYQIDAGLIVTISRGDYACDHLQSILSAYKSLGFPKEIIGLDLAGNENDSIPSSLPMQFTEAKREFGLGITIHAGETGNPENIIQAIEHFNADRIGHGTAATLSQKAMNLIKDRDICIEVCPISNRLTGAVKAQEPHPLVRFIENDLPFVICSDNPAIHKKGLSSDYLMFFEECNNQKILDEMFERQKKYSFLGRRN